MYEFASVIGCIHMDGVYIQMQRKYQKFKSEILPENEFI